ncbi:MAG: hypothetical protein KBD31_04000, partial [Proteobacteria bacterium]|nr:hypothetical protein [Pseudomonadota bacterium]
MKLINLVKTSACTLALGCAAYAASAHTVDGSSTAQMGLSALQSPLDTLKPQDLNNPKQKEVIRQAISRLKGPNVRHHGHLNKKIAMIKILIDLSDKGQTLSGVMGIALTVRPDARKEVIDLFALTYADLTIP